MYPGVNHGFHNDTNAQHLIFRRVSSFNFSGSISSYWVGK